MVTIADCHFLLGFTYFFSENFVVCNSIVSFGLLRVDEHCSDSYIGRDDFFRKFVLAQIYFFAV